MTELKQRVGRPIRPVLSRDTIAIHALELVTDHGFEKLTMSQLAKKLGVAPSALYNHLDNKADLVLLIQDALVSQVSLRGMAQLIEGEVSLAAALEDWARSYRSVFASYPSLIPLIAVTPVSEAPQTSHMYDTVAKALITAGVPEDHVITVVVAFESFLFGSALDVNAPANVLDAPEGDIWLAHVIKASRKVSDPIFEAEGTEHPPRMNSDHATAPFLFGLQALIDYTLRFIPSTASAATS